MKTLTILAILLIVAANGVFSYCGITRSVAERLIGQEPINVTVGNSHILPVLPLLGAVTVVGVCLLLGNPASRQSTR